MTMNITSQVHTIVITVAFPYDINFFAGSEYIQRLRKQFLRLHPTPDWAELPSVRRARKRRERELRLRAGDRGKVDEEVEFSDSDLEVVFHFIFMPFSHI